MAYINQYEADMAQNRRDDQAIGEILSGVKEGMRGFEENRRRALEEKRRGEQEKMQKFGFDLGLAEKGASSEDIKNYHETGDATSIFDKYSKVAATKRERDQALFEADAQKKIYDANQLKKPLEERDDYRKTIGIESAKAGVRERAKNESEERTLAKQEAKNAEVLDVPGYGRVKTETEARELRAAAADANDAIKLIDELKSLGTNVSVMDRGRIAKINSIKNVLAGKLRLPLTGPGALTQDEFERLIDTMGDPSKLFGSEKIEMGKLDTLKDTLNNSLSSKYNLMRDSRHDSGPTAPTRQVAQQPAVSPVVQQRVQSMTPEQKRARYEELKMKAGGR